MLLKTYHTYLNALSIGICGSNINHLCKLYRALASKKQKHHGRKFMVKYMKDLNSIAERYAIYQPIEPIKFRKSDRNGFPSEIRLFKPYLRNEDPAVVKMALAIFRSVELFRLPPSHDIETVLRQPQYDEEVVKDIISFIPRFVRRLSKPQYRDMLYHYTVKNGPNGPALANSDTDLGAVRQDTDIYDALRMVSAKLNDTNFPDENYPVTKTGIHSRLTQFSEKAGKTRTIAVVDYYSQRALYPLHQSLMRLLRGLSSDGTYSHRNVGNYAKQKTKEKSFISTSDMTAFTDLFPAVIQYQLLLHLEKDHDLAEAWWTLLSKRHFVVAWSGENVTYGTGQPMGAYASWPLCTLAHHLVVHYCAYKCSVKNINAQYRIIGDDNEITNPVVSALYKKTLTSIGCELNPYKGTCSIQGAEHSGAEVAKRLYLNGIDLSPLTPGIIQGIVDLNLLNSSIKEIITSFDNPALPVYILNHVIREEYREKAWMLCTNPFNGAIEPGKPGYDRQAKIWGPLMVDDDHLKVYHQLRIKSLVQKATDLHNDPGGLLGQWVRLTTEPQNPVKSSEGDVGLNPLPAFAAGMCQKRLYEELFQTLNKLKAPYQHLVEIDGILEQVEYLPDPKVPFMDLKDIRSTRTSLLVERTFEFLEAGEDPWEIRWKIPPTLNI